MFGEKIEDYEILEHLGKGGFAHVYRARCRKSGLFVAIKMIDKALMASAGMIGRVRQEVTIHSRLKHPSILELYTFFEDAHYVYLVLELAHNGELAKHFKLGTLGLSEKAAAEIFKQVVSGVLYLHTHNIIHRDLSLNNLLLTKDMYVKIADFGLATQLNGPDEKHVTMCGTPNYISPEVASREMHGLPADVWGLGCMLYTLLVGSPPFHTQHVKTTLNKVINADYKIPSDISNNAQDLLLKLLCKDPTKRITLKEIMEHPFLQYNSFNSNVAKQDLSRDSGFLTTLHSTQHSYKTKNDEKVTSHCLGLVREQNRVNFICQENVKPALFNVFPGTQVNNSFSNHSNGLICGINQKDKNTGTPSLPRQTPVQMLDSACNENSLLDNMRNLDLKCAKVDNCTTPLFSHENKENIPKTANPINSLGVPPLCADRLPNISHRTRNAILKIEPNSVTVEFIKKRGKDREERVVEICKISKDGMKIFIYVPDPSQNKIDTEQLSPDEVFSYHNLPHKHWKKYLYAARFVDLVKAKTPKITLYSPLAKCQLMENGTDIDMFFYSGEKVTFSSCEGIKIIDKNLKTHYDSNNTLELKYLTEHFEECSSRIKRVQDALSCIPDECFPLIIGKRPPQTVNCINVLPSPGQASAIGNYNTPNFNLGSFHRTTAGSSHAPSDYNPR